MNKYLKTLSVINDITFEETKPSICKLTYKQNFPLSNYCASKSCTECPFCNNKTDAIDYHTDQVREALNGAY